MNVRDQARAALVARGEADPDKRLAEILWPHQSEAMRMHYQEGKRREVVDAWYAAAVKLAFGEAGLI